MSKDQKSSADESRQFLLAEFSALRQEIIKRTDIQHQLISFALIAVGAFLTAEAEIAILAYPILALFLAAAWVQNDCQIANLGTYIRKRIEPLLLDGRGGWESIWASTPDHIKPLGSLAHLASRGVFFGSQLAMWFASLLTYEVEPCNTRLINLLFRVDSLDCSKLTLETHGVLLLVFSDVIAMILTLYLLRRHKIALDTREEWLNVSTRPVVKEIDD